jgi:glycosyltransferase involved in cell wall biosynthesis
MALSILTILIFCFWLINLCYHLFHLPNIPKVDIQKEKKRDESLISVIIAAKDEEEKIGETIDSLLNQEYSNLEIILVNDRSVDNTPQIMKHFTGDPRVKVIHIHTLPAGWLGKNHALYQGYLSSRGEYLLFTDADIDFHPAAIRSTMTYLLNEQADHLTLLPNFIMNSFWMKLFLRFSFFGAFFYKPPWKPNDDRKHKDGMGIGAFNLLSRQAYEKIGTHDLFRMHPVDDVCLGRRIKETKQKQRFAVGKNLISVEWYPDFKSAAKGLEKNIFAALEFSGFLLAMFILAFLTLFFYPFVALFLYTGVMFWLTLLSILIAYLLFYFYMRKLSYGLDWDLFFLPISVLLFLFVVTRSCVLTVIRGGIIWRGTFYPLKDLQK